MTTEELKERAIEMLENDDDLVIDTVNELDSWNGFADGFRGYPMDMIDEMYLTVADFLSDLTEDFDKNDDFFINTIYGLESTNDLADYYRSETSPDEIVDNLIDEYYHINFYDDDFDEIISELVEREEAA